MKHLVIRPATLADAAALLSIYAPHVTHTAVSFEESLPSVEEFASRMHKTIADGFPYLVAESDGEIVGYSYASHLNSRSAWRYTVETTIYVKTDCHHCGVGKALVSALEEALRWCGHYYCIANIAYPRTPDDPHLTDASVRFHEALGYKKIAHFTCCGYKFGRWYDVVYMEHHLADRPKTPAPLRPFKKP